MSYPIVIPWLPSTGNLAAIAPLQTLAAAGALTIVANVPNLPNSPYKFDRVARAVSLTSAGDDSGVNFTITGIGSAVDGDGNPTQIFGPIFEEIAGPNADTVSTTKIFTQVNSITTNAAVPEDVSAGFGEFGITDYVFLDYNRTMFQTSVQLQFIARTALEATVYQSLSKLETPNLNGYLDQFEPTNALTIPGFAVSADLTSASTNQLGVLASPVSVVWATMTATAADSLYFTVLQQGLRS